MCDDSKPLVSIIVPAYNAERWIARAIASVLSQTYGNVEAIVVDDGSADGTADVCRNYGSRIRYFHQGNAGVSAARNTGIASARGEVIGFLDADDELLPRMVEVLMEVLHAFPEAGAASGAHILDCAEGNIRKPAKGKVLPGSQEGGIVGDFFKTFTTHHLVLTGSVLVRRKVLSDVGGFRPELSLGEDFELWSRIAGRYPWAFADKEVMVYHHSVDSSVTLTAACPMPIQWMYGEDEMRARVRESLWDGYRLFRSTTILRRCRAMLAKGNVAEAREMLSRAGPLPKTMELRLLSLLSRCPPFIVLCAAGVFKGMRRALRGGTGRGAFCRGPT